MRRRITITLFASPSLSINVKLYFLAFVLSTSYIMANKGNPNAAWDLVIETLTSDG